MHPPVVFLDLPLLTKTSICLKGQSSWLWSLDYICCLKWQVYKAFLNILGPRKWTTRRCPELWGITMAQRGRAGRATWPWSRRRGSSTGIFLTAKSSSRRDAVTFYVSVCLQIYFLFYDFQSLNLGYFKAILKMFQGCFKCVWRFEVFEGFQRYFKAISMLLKRGSAQWWKVQQLWGSLYWSCRLYWFISVLFL